MTASGPEHTLHRELREHTAALLRERGRIGLSVVVPAIVLMAAVDFVVHRPVFPVLGSIAAAQAVATLWGLRRLDARHAWHDTVTTLLAVFAFIFGTGVYSDVYSSNVFSLSVIGPLVALVAATMLPWGPRPQIVMASITCGSGATALLAVTGVSGGFANVAIVIVVIGIVSVLVAQSIEASRLQERHMDAALSASKARAEEEAAIAAALFDVSHTVNARLGHDDLLDTVLAVTTRLLGGDWSILFLYDEGREAYRLARCDGVSETSLQILREVELPADLPGIHAGTIRSLEEIDASDPFISGFNHGKDSSAALVIPIGHTTPLTGLLAHGYRRTVVLTDRDRRIALGIAQAVAPALVNSQLIDGLQAASRLKSEFVATMSHELRTPLNIIVGYVDMLLEGACGSVATAQADMLSNVRRSAVELFDLVSATLDLGRLENGRESVVLLPTSVHEIFTELDHELAAVAADGVQLAWDADLAELPILTDRTKLKTVIKNLAGNALKFTKVGRVSVVASWRSDTLTVSVTDTGVGIPADALPTIFEMFRQVDGSSTRRFGGVGLGLHIVKRLTELLGGTIDVTSEVGEGSVFALRIPAAAAGETAARTKTA